MRHNDRTSLVLYIVVTHSSHYILYTTYLVGKYVYIYIYVFSTISRGLVYTYIISNQYII